MADVFVIAEPCIGVLDRGCLAMCPVDCIHDGGDQLYIDPDVCTGCGACEHECPVNAIFPLPDLPSKWASYIEKNAQLAKQRAH
jgi:NAD-dependent dihydropyrimidine dehydrogenase PreA subunit